MKCAVLNCKNSHRTKNKKIGFLTFPTNESLRKQWVHFCRREVKSENARICSEHFLQEDFANQMQFEMGFATTRRLKPCAIPTITLEAKPSSAVARNERILRRRNKKVVSELLSGAYVVPEVEVESEAPQLQSESNVTNMDNAPVTVENAPSTCPSEAILIQKIEELENLIDTLRRDNFILREEKIKRDKELRTLEMRVKKAEFEQQNIEQKLKAIFTAGQIEKLKGGLKRRNWSEKDISHSITLYSASAKAYRLLKRQGFPLPAIRTLQKWAQKIKINPGIIEPVMKILSATTLMDEKQKMCVLSFDEMKIRKSYCYDRSSDTTFAPVDYVQVAMLRGLIAKWKQPVFFDFDCRMTVEILFNIINTVKMHGFHVVAVVSDLGGANRGLFNELGVSYENPCFVCDESQIFVFADAPHLIKLLRNNFLDHGFIINGKSVGKEVILDLLSCTSSNLTITHKINNSHLTVAGPQRQKVKVATKLFSHTVAQAITRAASFGHLGGQNWEECHMLFKMTNDWFDVMNVRVPYPDSRKRTHAYGLALEIQDPIIENMTSLIQNMRVVNKYTLLPFQKGIIQSNKALKLLLEYLKNRFGMQYILTYRLNQDVLENFFGVIRNKGGSMDDHPDLQMFKYRLRSYILGYNEGVISENANTSTDDTPDLEKSYKSLTGTIFKGIALQENDEQSEIMFDPELEELAYDGLENVAGYICKRLHTEVPNIRVEGNDENYSWVNHLSEGGLRKPTQELMNHLIALQYVFDEMNGDSLLITDNYIQKHIDNCENVKCNIKVKTLFFRALMYFRIRKLNKIIADNAYKRKRKFVKIVT